jgi:lambda family phage portal protein
MSFWAELRSSVRELAIGALGLRDYEAGKITRLDRDFMPTTGTADQENLGSLSIVRGRARTLEQSDAYSSKYVQITEVNVPGPKGFKFQSRVMEFGREGALVEDTLANAKIEAGWKEWCKRGNCTVSGDMSFREFTHLMTAHWKRDGEFLARKVIGIGRFGIQLQALEPDLLDETFNTRLDNGNRVIMGVEVNEWRRPVAFWLRREDDRRSLGLGYFTLERQRITADQIYFGFTRTRAFSSRGMSAMATAMMCLQDNRAWEKASLVNARHSAGRVGFLYDEDPNSGAADIAPDDYGSNNEPILKVEPGTVQDIGSKRFVGVESSFPHQQHTPFVDSNLHRASAGLRVAHHTLSGNMSGVTYSSARIAALDERDMWRMDQQYLVEALLEPIFTDWLTFALTTQAVQLPFSKLDKFNKPVFTGKTWDWVDPLKDITAAVMEIKAGLGTATKYLAEQGEDLLETYTILKRERDLAEQMGLSLDVMQVSQMVAAAQAATATDQKPKDSEEAQAQRLLEAVQGAMSQVKTLTSETRRTTGEVYAEISDIREKVEQRPMNITVQSAPMQLALEIKTEKGATTRQVVYQRDERGQIVGSTVTEDVSA